RAAPGAGIDCISEAVRGRGKWLRWIDAGVALPPRLRAYLPESSPTHTDSAHCPAQWISEPSWQCPRITDTMLPAPGSQICDSPPHESTDRRGHQGGRWLQFGEAAGMAGDQAAHDARSYTCAWDVENGLKIVGTPTVRATLTSNRDRGVIAARLCDVAPDGSSRLVTIGLFNLTHHSSHEHPEPLTPGRPVTVDFPLLATAHRFAPGHRLRLRISASFWPNLWPSPETTLITVDEAPELSLPLRTVTS